MILKGAKYSALGAMLMVVMGCLIFGTDVLSYFHSSANAVQSVVKDSVPIEFELQRARDMIDNIIPELQANIRIIAQDEVEIAALKADINDGTENLAKQKNLVTRFRAELDEDTEIYEIDGRKYSREHLTERLARLFERYQEAHIILASKHKLLETRERSLLAAMQMLDRARSRKAELEQEIEGLVAQNRMIQAASVKSHVHFDGSQLSKAESLLSQIQKRLNVAERVLAHESEFLPLEPDSGVSEAQVLMEIDDYFAGADEKRSNQLAKIELK